MKYDDTFEVINKMAQVKMAMNNHKGAIEEIDTHTLLNALEDEVTELRDAITEGDIIDIIAEAADIHNFLVGLTHQQIIKYRNRKHVKSES